MIEENLDTNVKILHTDSNKEFFNEEFGNYTAKKGIELNLMIMEAARFMFNAMNLPLKLWYEVIQTSVFLVNQNFI